MALRYVLICDAWAMPCDRQLEGDAGEPVHRLRKRARERGWRQASSNGLPTFNSDGPRDYCPRCAALIQELRGTEETA
jgi:hypothetical protein